MNDFDYDVMQKKRVAKSAANRKRGSKSKKCSLPSDYMTNAQWKKECGKVTKYKLSEPMDYGAFLSMPKDIQEEYINRLCSMYGVTISALVEMFKVNRNTIARHLAALNLKYSFERGSRMSIDQKRAFEFFLHGENMKPIEITESETESEEHPCAHGSSVAPAYEINEINITCSGYDSVINAMNDMSCIANGKTVSKIVVSIVFDS